MFIVCWSHPVYPFYPVTVPVTAACKMDLADVIRERTRQSGSSWSPQRWVSFSRIPQALYRALCTTGRQEEEEEGEEEEEEEEEQQQQQQQQQSIIKDRKRQATSLSRGRG